MISCPLRHVASSAVFSALILQNIGFDSSAAWMRTHRVVREIFNREFLSILEWVELLRPVRLSKVSWASIERTLASIAANPELPNGRTLFCFYDDLASQKLLPVLRDPLVPALQLIVNSRWVHAPIEKLWTTYVLSHLQHNGFEDFAAAANLDIHRRGISLVDVVCALMELAVAEETHIDIVGHWGAAGIDDCAFLSDG